MWPNLKGCIAADPAKREEPATTPMVEQARARDWMVSGYGACVGQPEVEGEDTRGLLR